MKTIESIKYPFRAFKRLFNFYWVFVPLIGLIAFAGYIRNIVEDAIHGENKKLPEWGDFWSNVQDGLELMIFILVINTFLFGLMFVANRFIPDPKYGFITGAVMGIFVSLLEPIMILRYIDEVSYSSGWNVLEAIRFMFNNFFSYIWLFFKMGTITVVFLTPLIPIMTLITLKVMMPNIELTPYLGIISILTIPALAITIPAMELTPYAMLGDFYRENQ